jgi:hypothetical protein
MIYIILIHEIDFYNESNVILKSIDGKMAMKKEVLNNTVYLSSLSNPENCISIHSPTPIFNDYDPDEIENIIKTPDNLMCSNLEYRNREFLHQVLQIVADNFKCYVDNDFGTLLSASDFMKKWNSNPDWNWSNDLEHDDE